MKRIFFSIASDEDVHEMCATPARLQQILEDDWESDSRGDVGISKTRFFQVRRAHLYALSAPRRALRPRST